jgi:PRC-barrel domain
MRAQLRAAAAVTLIAFCAAVYSAAQDNPAAQPQAQQPPSDSGKTPGGVTREPTVTVLDHHEVQGILGKEVRSTADEDMGRIVDVVVDQDGQVRAAIIDFGGFLGVGSRKIAVAWNALRFLPTAKKGEHIALELTRDQVRAAPEFKEDKPVVVLGASGNLESLPLL